MAMASRKDIFDVLGWYSGVERLRNLRYGTVGETAGSTATVRQSYTDLELAFQPVNRLYWKQLPGQMQMHVFDAIVRFGFFLLGFTDSALLRENGVEMQAARCK
jgi:hypothetical protein